MHYLKKVGLIRRNITHEAPNNAMAITTWVISFFHCSLFPDDIITPATTIAQKHTINITESNILLIAPSNTGNALTGVTTVLLPSAPLIVVPLPYSIHLPTNGTLVYKDIPQQLSLDGLQTHLLFSRFQYVPEAAITP